MNVFKGLLLIAVLFAGCQSEKKEIKQISVAPTFFDLKGYFKEEVNRLNGLQPGLDKTVAVNEKSETKQLSKLDYQQELDIFVQSDINRIDWVDKYSVDSTFQENQLTAIEYRALRKDLRTRRIAIQFQDGKVSKIDIANGGQNMAAGSQQRLIYEPATGYHIESIQRTKLFEDKIFKIDVKFFAGIRS